MKGTLFWISAVAIATFVCLVSAGQNETIVDRNGKVFSLFSIVQFKNTGCKSQSSMTSGQSSVRNGTCYTSSECSSKGGTASGNCAAGFGVCCLFLVTATGSSINQNCTYLRNPSFPSVYSATSSLSYTVTKCSTDICYLRLDFETFVLISPTEAAGYSCPDTFKVTTNTGMAIPTFCGKLTGQHIYVDLGAVSTDTGTLAFTFSTSTSTIRTWEIKVSQISCNNPNRPPNGCLQYWTTLVGRFTTFNFAASTASNLPSMSYAACIRRAAGYCCVQYSVCSGVTNAFSLDTNAQGLTDTQCTGDYITIPGSSATACTGGNQALTNKYCGYYLGGQTAAQQNAPVCDCTAPFEVYVTSDSKADTISATSRGDCLDFQQIPC